MAVVLCFKMRKNTRVLCYFYQKRTRFVRCWPWIALWIYMGNPKENTRSGAPLERGRTVYTQKWTFYGFMNSMNIGGVWNLKPQPPPNRRIYRVYFHATAMLTAPQCPLRSRRIAEAREQLDHCIWQWRTQRAARDARRLLPRAAAYVAVAGLAGSTGET